jgi:CheY-like chemotaxis protein
MTDILIVDDYEVNLYQLQVLLEGNGYQVATAANGAEALAAARAHPPALIFTDILMPVMDGFSLCRELKKDPRLKSIPLIFYSATYTDDRDQQFALDLGAACYLAKPVEPQQVLESIRETLALSHRPSVESSAPCATAPTPGGAMPEQEAVVLKQYNEVLVRKLESKDGGAESGQPRTGTGIGRTPAGGAADPRATAGTSTLAQRDARPRRPRPGIEERGQ